MAARRRTEDRVQSAADPEAVFSEAMADVEPLSDRERQPAAKRDTGGLAAVSPPVQTFIVEQQDGAVSGRAHGVNRKLLRRLGAGEFGVQETVDLHRMRVEPARDRLMQFIGRTAAAGGGCVRVVHGRGLHSPGGVGELRARVPQWLAHGPVTRHIVAFCSAAPRDGGTGALYVLVRGEAT